MVQLFYEKQLERLIDTTLGSGLLQHSEIGKPILYFGSSVDDNSRGLIVASRVSRLHPEFDMKGVHRIKLDYIRRAQRNTTKHGDKLFHNYFEPVRKEYQYEDDSEGFKFETSDGKWAWRTDPSTSLYDCFGRVMWALGEFIGSNYPIDERHVAEEIFLSHLDVAAGLIPNASKAFTLQGLSNYYSMNQDDMVKKVMKTLAESLGQKFHEHKDDTLGWKWFAEKITYCNPRLPHSMIRSGHLLQDNDIFQIGIESLDFLIHESFDEAGIFHAIGNKEWYVKGEEPSLFDQQTVEAGGLVEACVDAFKITNDSKYLDNAKAAFDWFYGKNIARESMLDPVTGGVYDAITESGINRNQGAESVLSYLLAATKIEEVL